MLHYVTDGRVKNISLSERDIIKYRVHYFSDLLKKEGLSRRAIWIFWWTKYKEFVPLPDDPFDMLLCFFFNLVLINFGWPNKLNLKSAVNVNNKKIAQDLG